MIEVKRALISVSDKTGLVEFAKGLREYGIEIISTGGTYELLKEKGIDAKKVSEVTDFPEILGGRVKTLHPLIFGGILAKRDSEAHLEDISRTNISAIDMVVINFYPFEEAIRDKDLKPEEAVEQVDIGGPSALRSAAKNYENVVPVSSPEIYSDILEEMEKNNGKISVSTSLKLAGEVFFKTYKYDKIISDYFSGEKDGEKTFPKRINLNLTKIRDLRYGENPHQKASFYSEFTAGSGLLNYQQIHGKELSYNNLIDIEAALSITEDFKLPCTAIIKHTNPCGVGVDENLAQSFDKALACDSLSAFGGIFSFNRNVDIDTAEKLSKMFIEIIAAPDFDDNAFKLLAKKKNLRLLKKRVGISEKAEGELDFDFKKVKGGFLIQEYDRKKINVDEFKVVTKRQPTESEIDAMLFGWKIIKYIKSNAVIFTAKDRTLGIGAGQMSRIDSCELAIRKAEKSNISLKGSAVSSDAFFPFSDNIELIAKSGAASVIQPGGSIKDKEVIEAADKYNLTMLFTGYRQFRH